MKVKLELWKLLVFLIVFVVVLSLLTFFIKIQHLGFEVNEELVELVKQVVFS
ncbi:hypothetical protein GW927_04705 [Candidatus Pacearchaeota archaeon]|nr:hypothetical protein [Candidatus Pacearchaeota archaeon]